MDLIVRIPDEIAPHLQASGGDLSRRALEALALEEYRSERINKAQLREMLGFETRYELEGFFKAHHFYDGYTFEEIEQQVKTMKQLGF
jgi:hypothetical protein